MKRKLSGSATATITVFLASGMLASTLGVRQYTRLTTETSWVAAIDLPAGQVIRQTMLKQARVPNDSVGISNSAQLLGKKLTAAKKSGDVFSPNELGKPKRQWLSQQVPEGKVLYTLSRLSGGIPWSQLRRGDKLDVLVRGRSGVRIVASGVNLIGALHSRGRSGANTAAAGAMAAASAQKGKGGSATSLVVAVAPADVYPLASIGESETVSLVLHGEADIRSGAKLSIRPQATHREIEVVSGLSRSTVLVKL